jgi:hypothetical protein
MWGIAIVVAVAALALLSLGAWLLGPTLKTLRGPAFEPAAKDDASVERAQLSGPAAGTGAGA